MDAKSPAFPKTKTGIVIKLPAPALAADLSSWLPQTLLVTGILAAAILAAAGTYLWPSPLEFPMDDSYIHFVYADNLSERGGLFFNFPDEKGVGSSSLLWVLILAAADRAGLSMHWVSKLAGLASLAAVGAGLYHLLRPLLPTRAALAVALLVVLSGHMIWFALSGMETMLFLALGMLALLCYREERWGWLGAALGLLAITRIEGLLLAVVIGGMDAWRRKAIGRGLLVAGAVAGIICAPWFLYLWLRTGYFLPTSGIGRHHSNLLSIQIATAGNESLAWLSRFPALAFPLMWIGYSFEFVLGGFALPGPYLEINPGLGTFDYKLSIWAIVGLAATVLPLTWISCKQLRRFLRTKGWASDAQRLPLVILLVWMLLHNLAYMIYLPILGAASRYAILNHVGLWLILGLGMWYARASRFKLWLAGGLLSIALANTVYWNGVYDSNLEHMTGVRIPAANYIREQIPEGEVCAAFDVGALRYYGQRPLVDLGGLVDPDLVWWVTNGRLDQYLVNHGATCLAIPGRSGTNTDGVLDILKESRLSESNLVTLEPVEVFEIDRERWLIGYLPTVNYQATVTMYRMSLK